MKLSYQRYLPLIISIIVLLILVVISMWRVLERNGGQFTYAIDDPYIHMAVARNVVEYGVWGTTPFGFNSSTSSLIYPIILAAGFKLLGVQELLPLFINIGAAIGILAISDWVLRRYQVNQLVLTVTLILLIFFTPFIFNIFTGMEHLIHCILNVIFFYLAVEILAVKSNSRQTIAVFFLVTGLLSATRYEGLFAIAIVCALLVLRRRILLALATAFWGAFSVTIYGIYSMSQGSMFLPNSVYIKGQVNNVNGLWGQIGRLFPQVILNNLYQTDMLWPVLVLLTLGIIIFFINKHKGVARWWTKTNLWLLLMLGSIILHVEFSIFFYTRYEAYLVHAMIVVMAILVGEIYHNKHEFQTLIESLFNAKKRFRPYLIGTSVLVILPVLALLVYFSGRALTLVTLPNHTDDIYQQQYQMALFIHKYYPNTPFAINDTGAISFLNRIPLLDLWGLGTVEIARAGGDNRVEDELVWGLFERDNIHYAMIYNEWVKDLIPPHWIEVAVWELEERHSAAHSAVHFYAATVTEAEQLLANLKDYEASIPSGVLVSYSYP